MLASSGNLKDNLATAVAVVTLLTPVFVITIFILRSFISQAVDKALGPIWDKLNSHSDAIAKLQGIEEGKRFMQVEREQARDE